MRIRSYLMALLAPYAVLGVIAFAAPHHAGAQAAAKPVAAAPALPAPGPAPAPSHEGFADVVARVRPAIVSIMASKPGEQQMFFGGGGDAPMQRGIGSGMLVTADGLIMTNNHVVDGATSLRVRLADGREFVGRVLGADSHTDVAVVKIEARGLPTVQFADSDKLAVGQYALAIGSPFGLESSVTLGIVSATSRGSLGITDYEDFIQTDAAINPGNSGGALVAGDGKVIGMSTAIIGSARGNVGIGLAVPANLARAVMKQLVDAGKVERGFLGAGIQDVTPDLAQALGHSGSAGALVGDLVPGGPAERAGIRSGDIVVEIDGQAIASSRTLRLRVAGTAPGTAIKVVVERDGKRLAPLAVKLGTLPADRAQVGDARPSRGSRDDADQPPAGYGLQVGKLTADIARQLDLPRNAQGVVVTNVQPGSRADEAGLRRGDLIEELDRKPVRDGAAFAKALRSESKSSRLLRVRRGDATRYVALGTVLPN